MAFKEIKLLVNSNFQTPPSLIKNNPQTNQEILSLGDGLFHDKEKRLLLSTADSLTKELTANYDQLIKTLESNINNLSKDIKSKENDISSLKAKLHLDHSDAY